MTLINFKVGILMRYFSNIMMDDRTIDCHETVMGKDETVPLSKADLSKFEDSILVKIQGMIAGAPVPVRTSGA
jgi:hypothetical protein